MYLYGTIWLDSYSRWSLLHTTELYLYILCNYFKYPWSPSTLQTKHAGSKNTGTDSGSLPLSCVFISVLLSRLECFFFHLQNESRYLSASHPIPFLRQPLHFVSSTWSNPISSLASCVWIYKLLQTPVFSRTAPHVRRCPGSSLKDVMFLKPSHPWPLTSTCICGTYDSLIWTGSPLWKTENKKSKQPPTLRFSAESTEPSVNLSRYRTLQNPIVFMEFVFKESKRLENWCYGKHFSLVAVNFLSSLFSLTRQMQSSWAAAPFACEWVNECRAPSCDGQGFSGLLSF